MKRVVSWFTTGPRKKSHCSCMAPPFSADAFKSSLYLYDETHHGEVEVLICNHCASHWLQYTLEFEGYTGSGRWYKGLLSPFKSTRQQIKNPTKYLSELPWYVYGGPHFGHSGEVSSGPLKLHP